MAASRSLRQLATVPSLSWDDCRLLVESLTDYAIFMLDPEGRVATWNVGAERIKGYRADEIIGEHFSRFYPADEIASGRCERELAQAADESRVDSEGWRLRKDGTRFWAVSSITALRTPEGHLRGFAKITRDLTKQRASEEAVRRSEERFRLMVDAVSDSAIFMLDPAGVVSTWNVGAERMTGYTSAEILGHTFARFLPPEAIARHDFDRELDEARTRGRFEGEGWRVRKDGTRFWAKVVITSLRDAQGTHLGFSKVTQDLTMRRAAEQTEARLAIAEDAATKAEEANRIKDEFIATISHELRTPLTAIVGWAHLLRSQPLDPKAANAVEVIDRNAKAQIKIIEDLLDVSRIVSGKLRLSLASMDFALAVDEAVDVVRPSALAKQIDLRFYTHDSGALVGDKDRLRQVVWNLLSNAIKFTPHGGSVRVTLERHGSRMVLAVADTGRGIDPAFMPYVFERFKQQDQTITRRVGGLGLGLALARHLVELHGGTVTASSAGADKGATFIVSIPIRAVALSEVQGAGEEGAPGPVPASLAGVRVVVIDDERDARDLVATILEASGSHVQAVASAREGFDAIERFHPHVVISDIGMPIEDGYSLARRLRSSGGADAQTPTIALTAFTRAEDRERALAAGFTTHISKPVDADELVQAVASLAILSKH